MVGYIVLNFISIRRADASERVGLSEFFSHVYLSVLENNVIL